MAESKPWRSKAWLYDRYTLKKMTIEQMAEECRKLGYSVTSMTIYNNLKANDLIKNGRKLGKRSYPGSKTNTKGKYY